MSVLTLRNDLGQLQGHNLNSWNGSFILSFPKDLYAETSSAPYGGKTTKKNGPYKVALGPTTTATDLKGALENDYSSTWITILTKNKKEVG